MRRWVALGVSVMALVAAGPAWASSDSLTLSVAPGANDAPNGMATTASWTLANPGHSYTVAVHYAQGGGCAPDPFSDGGTALPSLDGTDPSTGPSATGYDQLLPATWTLCAWLLDNNLGPAVTATAHVIVTVASADTLGLTISPTAIEGRTVLINATGTNYDRGALLALHQSAGPGGCGTSPQTDPGIEVVSGVAPGGTGPYTALLSNTSIFSRGTWRLCAWLADQATGTVLAAAEQVITVPGIGAHLSFSAPGSIAKQAYFPFTFHITMPADIPVTAIVDAFDKAHRKSCPAAPQSASSANELINQDVNDTTTSTGSIAITGNFTPSWSGGVLLCGWLQDGWSVAVHPPVVAGPVAATVNQVGNFVFRGPTSQHKAISIFATPFAARIAGVTFTAVLRCHGTPRYFSGKRWNGVTTQAVSAVVFGIVKPDHHGRFAIRLTGHPAHVFTLTGRVLGKAITGTFTERGRSWVYTHNHAQNLACTSGVVHFTVRRP